MVDLILNFRILSKVVIFCEFCFKKIIPAVTNGKEARETSRKGDNREKGGYRCSLGKRQQ